MPKPTPVPEQDETPESPQRERPRGTSRATAVNSALERKLHVATVLLELKKEAHELLGIALPHERRRQLMDLIEELHDPAIPIPRVLGDGTEPPLDLGYHQAGDNGGGRVSPRLRRSPLTRAASNDRSRAPRLRPSALSTFKLSLHEEKTRLLQYTSFAARMAAKARASSASGAIPSVARSSGQSHRRNGLTRRS